MISQLHVSRTIRRVEQATSLINPSTIQKMSSRTRVNALKDQICKSHLSKRQAEQSSPKKVARKPRTYGKASRSDDTLTQLWRPIMKHGNEETDDQNLVWDGNEDHTVEVRRRPKRRLTEYTDQTTSEKQQKARKSLRKKITGNMSDDTEENGFDFTNKKTEKKKKCCRKTAGNQACTNVEFHTQTITQMVDWSFTPGYESESKEGIENIENEQQVDVARKAEIDLPINRGPSYSPSNRPRKVHRSSGTSKIPILDDSWRDKSISDTRKSPKTPRRGHVPEIPASQSPATPGSLPLRGSRRRSPLKILSTNMPTSFNAKLKTQLIPQKVSRLEVKDALDSSVDVKITARTTSTPSKVSNPNKNFAGFVMPDKDKYVEALLGLSSDEPPVSIPCQASQHIVKVEIQDSDAESNEEYEDFSLPRLMTHREKNANEERCENGIGTVSTEKLVVRYQSSPDLGHRESQKVFNSEPLGCEPETCYGDDIGQETQNMIEELTYSTQYRSSGYATNVQGILEEYIQGKTQLMETQRLSIQLLDQMAPRTAESDIIISLESWRLGEIMNRTRTHISRKFRFPPPTCRLWLFEQDKTSALKYVAEISPAERSGQISNEAGVENANFRIEGASWVYDILQLYELAHSYTLVELKAREWLTNAPAPGKFYRIPPAVVDALVANIKCPLFDTTASNLSPSSSTEIQEAEEQILSCMKQFTQNGIPSSQAGSDDAKNEGEDDTHYVLPKPNSINNICTSSQATTVDLTPTPTSQDGPIGDDIIWETPMRPVVPSSTPSGLPTLCSGHSSDHDEPLVPYSITSSQLLTKSQLLPESLLVDIAPPPPLCLQDSEDDEEFDDFGGKYDSF